MTVPLFLAPFSFPLYRHQSTRSNMYRAHRVPKQGTGSSLPLLLFVCFVMNVTFLRVQVPLEPLVASLARPVTSRLERAVDILVFNPPYVPTYDEEMDAAQHDAGISGSWAGGADGMQVTDALLRQVDVGVSFLFSASQNPSHPLRSRNL